MAKDFLFELGLEEMPARFVPGILEQMRTNAEALLKDNRLEASDIKVFATPRRVALLVSGLTDRQADVTIEAKGPAKKAAFDAAGAPTKAALGFARGQGVNPEDLMVKAVDGGEYVFARKLVQGKPTAEVLPAILGSLISQLTFPKYMRWGSVDMKFVRPIRWMVSLYGSDVVPFEVAGVTSGRESRGHRFLAKGSVVINEPATYQEAMRKAYVMVDQDARRAEINRQIHAAAEKVGGKLVEDEGLLDEVTYLVEYPTALAGSVPEGFMSLPRDVIVTPMRDHQRYFPVENASGALLPYFITVRNGTDEHIDIVRAGNERVLVARLDDANFFFSEDTKRPLSAYVEPLKHVVFQESLGNLYEKTERVRKLAAGIADSLGVSDAEKGQVDRAAALCKADLVTNMVKEFTELQGVMGKEYAERSGEPAPVATAIFEHYLPRFAGDVVPSTTPGAILAVADKIDTIAGYFGIGMEPTGSQDPFGLRRQALGAVNILLSTGWHLLLGAVVDEAIAAFARQGALKADAAAVKASVMDFFKQRVENVFTDRGLRYDEIDAALAIGFDDLPETLARAEALAGFRATAGYETLAAGYTRANNLAKKNEGDTLRPEILTEPQETALYEAYTTTREAVEKHLGTRDYRAALDAMTTLKTPVDEFFDGLMVMVEDDAVRKNRLALLLAVANLMNSVGDLSRLQ